MNAMDLSTSSVTTAQIVRRLGTWVLYSDRTLDKVTIDRISIAVFAINPKVCVFLRHSLE